MADAVDLSVRDGIGFRVEEIDQASMFESADFVVDCLFMLVLHIFYFKMYVKIAVMEIA